MKSPLHHPVRNVDLSISAICLASVDARSTVLYPPAPIYRESLVKALSYDDHHMIVPELLRSLLIKRGYYATPALDPQLVTFLSHNSIGPNRIECVLEPAGTYILETEDYLIARTKHGLELPSRYVQGLRVRNAFRVVAQHRNPGATK